MSVWCFQFPHPQEIINIPNLNFIYKKEINFDLQEV